jgi:hypothetical protein
MSRVIELLVALARFPFEVRERAERLRPVEIPPMQDDAELGWEQRVFFEQLERTMVDADLERLPPLSAQVEGTPL